MATPLTIGMPATQDVGPNYTLRVTALDPTTGDLVAGVVIDTVVLDVSLVQGSEELLQTGQWFLVPGAGA